MKLTDNELYSCLISYSTPLTPYYQVFIYLGFSPYSPLSSPSCSFWAPSRFPSCIHIYSKPPLIPGAGCEVLEVCRWRRWDMAGRRTRTCQAWSNITESGCRVVSVDPHRLSTGRMSESRLDFSAASTVSWHQACALQPLPLMQIPLEKVKGHFDGAKGHPADSKVALDEPSLQMWTHFIYVFQLLWSHPRLPTSALSAVALILVI